MIDPSPSKTCLNNMFITLDPPTRPTDLLLVPPHFSYIYPGDLATRQINFNVVRDFEKFLIKKTQVHTGHGHSLSPSLSLLPPCTFSYSEIRDQVTESVPMSCVDL